MTIEYLRIDVPNSITYFNRAPIFEWYVLWLQEQIPKRHVFRLECLLTIW
jgi:hypothetical protein